MKSILITLMVIILPIGASAKSFTLYDLKEKAQQNHYGLKAKDAELRATKASINTIKSRYLPKIGVQAGSELLEFEGGNDSDKLLSIYAQMNLLNGLRDKRSLDRSKLNSLLVESEYQNFKWYLNLFIEEKYYGYLYVKKKLEINSDHIERVKKHQELVKKRYNSKLITETDYLEFQLHYKKLQSSNNYLRLERDQLLSEIAALVDVDDKEQFEIVGEIPHLHIQDGIKNLLEKINEIPTLRQFKMREDIAELNKKIASSGWLPSVDLRAEHGKLDEVETGINSEITSSRVVVMANWELFSGFSTEEQTRQASLNRSSIQYSKQQNQRDSKVTILKNFQSIKMLEETIDLEEENEKIARKLYENTLKEYRRGVKDSGALGGASETLANAQSRIYELKSNYILAKLELEKVLGQVVKFEQIKHKGHH